MAFPGCFTAVLLISLHYRWPILWLYLKYWLQVSMLPCDTPGCHPAFALWKQDIQLASTPADPTGTSKRTQNIIELMTKNENLTQEKSGDKNTFVNWSQQVNKWLTLNLDLTNSYDIFVTYNKRKKWDCCENRKKLKINKKQNKFTRTLRRRTKWQQGHNS